MNFDMPTTAFRFWAKLSVFLLPFVLAFCILTGLMMYVGESMPLSWVVGRQQAEAVLYRPKYGNRDQQFKTLSVNTRRPEVLALGSSRILQFRAGFFNRKPDTFYNAAAPAWTLTQAADLLYSLDRRALPRVLILAMDPPWFNDAYAAGEFAAPVSDIEHLFLVDRSVLQDAIRGEPFDRAGFENTAYFRREEPGGSGALALGMRAIRDGHGFRSDGSEQYGDFLIARWLWQPQQRENHMEMMRRGEQMYVYGDKVSETSLSLLSGLLDFAAHHDITVIGFMPSYAPQLWQEMLARGNHTYITALIPRLRDLFVAHDFTLFDFSDGASTATVDEEFFDGWHASELSNLRLYLTMLDGLPDILGPYSDQEVLSRIAAQAADTWDVFGMENKPDGSRSGW